MTISLKSAVLAASVLGACALGAGSASAMPLAGLDPGVATASDLAPLVQDVRWVCGPWGRCRWVPNYYAGPRRFYGPPRRHWGWRRHW